MTVMNDIKGDGHSLVAPRWSFGWIIYAIVALAILVPIVLIVSAIVKKPVKSILPGSSGGAESQSNIQMQGFY